MSHRTRRVIIRWALILFGCGWTVGTVLALQRVHSADVSPVDELVADTTILPVVFFGYALIGRYWPADLSAPTAATRQQRAVAQVRVGPIVTGAAFRIRGRHVVTSARAINLALNRPAEETTPPSGRARVTLRFPFGPGTDDDVNVSARVLAWGPARPHGPGHDVVLLRTLERLPRRIPSLRISNRTYAGRARILLPTDDATTGLPFSHRDVQIIEHRLCPWPSTTEPPDDWPGDPALGAPVVAVDTEDLDRPGSVVAAFATTPIGPGRSPAAFVDGRAVRDVTGSVTRRELLRTGTVVGGLLALGGAGVLTRGTLIRSGTSLQGAGWDALFEADSVRQYLNDKGFRIGTDLPKLSGIQSLDAGTDLSRFDFITAPNEFIAKELTQRAGTRFHGTTARPICTEEMLVLARRPAAEVLARAGLLTRPGGGPVEMFDMAAYLRVREAGTTWSEVGLTDLYAPGNAIKVASSDPTRGGGGQMLLWLLAEVQAGLEPPVPERRLWGVRGPFNSLEPAETYQLLPLLENGEEQMIFIYEHDALDFLLTGDGRVDDYVLLRTSPVVRLEQSVLTRIESFGNLFAHPDPELSRILVTEFHLRIRGPSTAIDTLLAGPLAPAVWSGRGSVEPGPDRRSVTVRPRDIRQVLNHYRDETR